jgi:hypothetical protein
MSESNEDATGPGTQTVELEFTAASLTEIDAWRNAQDDKPSRPEALRRRGCQDNSLRSGDPLPP